MLTGLCLSAQPLYWGAAPDGRFMLGSDPVDLAACDPTPTAFPSGTAKYIQYIMLEFLCLLS